MIQISQILLGENKPLLLNVKDKRQVKPHSGRSRSRSLTQFL